MKVKTLIELLKRVSPDDEVILKECGDEGYYYTLLKQSRTKRKGSIVFVGKSGGEVSLSALLWKVRKW